MRDAAEMFVVAGKLLVRHWPVLLALGLAGMAFRGAALWAAVEVSDHVNWLGQALIIFAPLGFLVAIILMLRVLRHDLPHAEQALATAAPADATTGRERRLIDVTTSMVVPFFAVYVSAGLLTSDVAQFMNEAGADEFNQIDFYGTGDGPDFSRVFISSGVLVAGLVLAAWVLRFIIGRVEKRWQFLGFAILGALVEVYWSANVAGYIDREKSGFTAWLQDRVVVARATEYYHTAVERLGPLGTPVKATTTWIWDALGSLDVVVIVPLAWITVGAVVLGHTLAPAPRSEHPWTDRARVPKPLARTVTGVADDVTSRFTAFFEGLRMMVRAGLIPMLLFGLAALLALRVPYFVSALWRLVVGPVESDTYVAWAPIEGAFEDALMLMVLAALLAAGVDRMLSREINSAEPQDNPAAPTTAAPA
jgi:hypothetical protein